MLRTRLRRDVRELRHARGARQLRRHRLHTCVPDIPQAWVAPGVQPMATQLPGAAGVAQLSHVPPQARSQHTPDAQTSGAWQSPFS